MECIRGKRCYTVGAAHLDALIGSYRDVLIDLGTGDGRYVYHEALRDPRLYAIGVDACRENLRTLSRKAPENTLFVIANALGLPAELWGRAHRITINFPWGSLLSALLLPDYGFITDLERLLLPAGQITIRLNGAALSQAGYSLADGALRVQATLSQAGFRIGPSRVLDAAGLRAVNTTWARKLEFGRDPRAVVIDGVSPKPAGNRACHTVSAPSLR